MEEYELPRITDVPIKKRHELFMKKLRLSSVFFDHRACRSSLDKLKDLLDYVVSLESLPEDAVPQILAMVAANIFRPFPSPSARSSRGTYATDKLFDPGIKRPLVEESWFLRRLFYRFLQDLVDSGLLRDHHIEDSFVKNLFNNALDADDHREAISVAKLLPCFWESYTQKRPLIWNTVRCILSRFVSESDRYIPSAITHLLAFACHRISEFQVPLVAESRKFLERVLIPLYKIRSYSIYSKSLSRCMLAFLDRDRELGNLMIQGILSGRQKPLGSASELKLLDELKSLMTFTSLPGITQPTAELLFRRIAKCLTNLHVKVVTKALNFLTWPRFVVFAKQHKQVFVPIIIPALEYSGNQLFWDVEALVLAVHVRQEYHDVEMDADW